jgi:hypothetical protein
LEEKNALMVRKENNNDSQWPAAYLSEAKYMEKWEEKALHSTRK